MASTDENCPVSLPVPYTVTVNTSATNSILNYGDAPIAANGALNGHSLSGSHVGFTRISEFSFAPELTGVLTDTNLLLTNGDFESSGSWTADGNWSISNGVAKHTGGNSGVENLYQTVNTDKNSLYKVSITIDEYESGDIRIFIGTTDPSERIKGVGTHTVYVDADDNNPQILYIQASDTGDPNGAFVGTVSEVSIEEVANHVLGVLYPDNISNTVAYWDFGDGYSLSGVNQFNANHTYNVPGIYNVSMILFDSKGNAKVNSFQESVSVYNYKETNLTVETTYVSGAKLIWGGDLSEKNSFNLKVDLSWQDYDMDEEVTVYLAASGSRAKPFDRKNKYAHLVPFHSFYKTVDGKPLDNKITIDITPYYYYITNNTITVVPTVSTTPERIEALSAKLLYATTDVPGKGDPRFYYYDDIPTDTDKINIIVSLDTSKHKLNNFYTDNILDNLNSTELNYMESTVAGVDIAGTTVKGFKVQVAKSPVAKLLFTSTGMKEMSSMTYKRQGDKFQVFVSPADENNNILKYYSQFLYSTVDTTVSALSTNYSTRVNWGSGGHTHNTYVSSISTNKFPYNNTLSATSLSSFLYLNIDPLSAGNFNLAVSAAFPELSTQNYLSSYGAGNVGIGTTSGYGNVGAGLGTLNNVISSGYTFVIAPSTNTKEIYKINEDINYSDVIKSYRFQSFLHDYDKLFDGVFTPFVGELSSSPTSFGKTIFEKIANFASNTNDVDYCNLSNLESLYNMLNEDIDYTLPTPPAELKRMYDLFSIKITNLIGGHERELENFDTFYDTISSGGRNVDLDNPITAATYTVTAGTNFVAKQRFNNEYILIKPQKVATKHVDGSSSGVSTTYPLSTYNIYNNWGWSLETTVSGASGLNNLYNFYPYTNYNTTTDNKTIKNNLIDFNNDYNTLTRTTTSLSAEWENEGGVIYDNLDFQIRKGLSL